MRSKGILHLSNISTLLSSFCLEQYAVANQRGYQNSMQVFPRLACIVMVIQFGPPVNASVIRPKPIPLSQIFISPQARRLISLESTLGRDDTVILDIGLVGSVHGLDRRENLGRRGRCKALDELELMRDNSTLANPSVLPMTSSNFLEKHTAALIASIA